MNRTFLKWFKRQKHQINQPDQREQRLQTQDQLSENFNHNIEVLRSVYAGCSDVNFHPFLIGGETNAILIYIEGLSNEEEIDDNVLRPLMQETAKASVSEIMRKTIPVSKGKKVKTFSQCIEELSVGNAILLIEQESSGLSLGLARWEKRGIEEPSSEVTIRGPREGFTETMATNTSQLRRIIKSPALKMQTLKIGGYTQTNVVIAYMEGLADKVLVNEVKNRLQRIKIDGILESGYIEELIEDDPYSPFPQLLSTERPDVACGNLLEGRVVILTEGTPFVLIAPISFFSLLQSSEDYYQRYIVSTAIRWLRYLFLGFSLLLPSLYVAVLTFHQEMVPTTLLLSIAASREGVPFPALVEAIIMEVAFEVLREAGVRLPKQVGAAVSIVGALVIGQAAVQAGLVSAPMVIVVAMTGISSFMIPRYIIGIAIRLLRFPIILLAGSLGLLGIIMGLILIVIHLCTLRSFGVPYLGTLAPLKSGNLKDVAIRAPWWAMDLRPPLTGQLNKYRQAPGLKPDPAKGDEK